MSCENGIPYGTGPSKEAIGAVEAKVKYTPVDVPSSAVPNAEAVIDFFLAKDDTLPIEFCIAVTGVFGAESGIVPKKFNKQEQTSGGSYNGRHEPGQKTFKYGGKEYGYSEETMRKFGYGKGLAQWTWARPLEFRDWYNNNASPSEKTSGVDRIDENASAITSTSINTQCSFAWREMSLRSGGFMKTIRSVTHVSHTSDPDGFKNNIKVCVDAITRGYENGSTNAMASVEFMNKYSGDYWGIDFRKRYEWALGVYEKIKNKSKYGGKLS